MLLCFTVYSCVALSGVLAGITGVYLLCRSLMDSMEAALKPPSPRSWIRECTRLHRLKKTVRTQQQVLERFNENQYRRINLNDTLQWSCIIYSIVSSWP